MEKAATIKILTTGRKLNERRYYTVTDNGDGTIKLIMRGQVNHGPNQDRLIAQAGGPQAILARCIEFEGTLDEFVKNQFAEARKSRERTAYNREEKLAELWNQVKSAANTATAAELLGLFDEMNKYDDHTSTGLCDFFFLGDNALTAMLLEVLGSYTATAFDDGAVIIKAGAKRYSNHRRYATDGSIKSLIVSAK